MAVSRDLNVFVIKATCIISCGLFTSSCTTAYTYKNVEFSSEQKINSDVEFRLTSDQVQKDIDVLLYALNTAYSGSKKLPKNQFKNLESDLKRLNTSITVRELGTQIQSFFSKVSDSHLNALYIGGMTQINFSMQNRKAGRVGRNLAALAKKTWITKIIRQNRKSFLVVAITEFPHPNSQEWDGFEEKVKKLYSQSDAFILDLRGNNGGDDSKGAWLADFVNRKQVVTPYGDFFDMNSPESFQLMANSPNIMAWFQKKPLEHASRDWVEKALSMRDRSLNGEEVDIRKELSTLEEPKKADSSPSNMKTRPTYILIDHNCASSGESTVDFFENIPHVKKVGQPTAGHIHFGNNGLMMLPNSSLIIQIATSFNTYKDGRFLEKSGISPDISVEDGQNLSM